MTVQVKFPYKLSKPRVEVNEHTPYGLIMFISAGGASADLELLKEHVKKHNVANDKNSDQHASGYHIEIGKMVSLRPEKRSQELWEGRTALPGLPLRRVFKSLRSRARHPRFGNLFLIPPFQQYLTVEGPANGIVKELWEMARPFTNLSCLYNSSIFFSERRYINQQEDFSRILIEPNINVRSSFPFLRVQINSGIYLARMGLQWKSYAQGRAGNAHQNKLLHKISKTRRHFM